MASSAKAGPAMMAMPTINMNHASKGMLSLLSIRPPRTLRAYSYCMTGSFHRCYGTVNSESHQNLHTEDLVVVVHRAPAGGTGRPSPIPRRACADDLPTDGGSGAEHGLF